jgi:hypothetical protein
MTYALNWLRIFKINDLLEAVDIIGIKYIMRIRGKS